MENGPTSFVLNIIVIVFASGVLDVFVIIIFVVIEGIVVSLTSPVLKSNSELTVFVNTASIAKSLAALNALFSWTPINEL
jgi:hypothetical protein